MKKFVIENIGWESANIFEYWHPDKTKIDFENDVKIALKNSAEFLTSSSNNYLISVDDLLRITDKELLVLGYNHPQIPDAIISIDSENLIDSNCKDIENLVGKELFDKINSHNNEHNPYL
jgi:hypothetical protein